MRSFFFVLFRFFWFRLFVFFVFCGAAQDDRISIIIPAFSLSLCDEKNGPFAKVSAERAATLLEYGTKASPNISSSVVFGLYSLEITDERSCVDQNDGRYLQSAS